MPGISSVSTKRKLDGTGNRAMWMAMAAASGMLLSACGQVPLPGGPGRGSGLDALGSRTVSIAVRPVLRSGKFRTATIVTPYTILDVARMLIDVFDTASPSAPIAHATIFTDALGSTIRFGNLAPQRSYRLDCTALDASGAVISDAASSSVTVTVGFDDQLAPIVLLVSLKDKVFSATGAIEAVDVREGRLVPVGTVSVTVSPTTASSSH